MKQEKLETATVKIEEGISQELRLDKKSSSTC